MNILCVEGNLSAGKTTFIQNIAEALDARTFYEPVSTNPYLEYYYKDPEKYALPMQFYLMSQRFEMHREAIEHLYTKRQNCLFDRSIWGDIVFAKLNWLNGNMSDLDYQNYNKMRDVMLRYLMVPHVVIYLKCSPETSYKRIIERGRTCEQGISIDYLKGLDSLHKELLYELANKGSKIVELDWEEFKPVSDVLPEIEKHLIKRV